MLWWIAWALPLALSTEPLPERFAVRYDTGAYEEAERADLEALKAEEVLSLWGWSPSTAPELISPAELAAWRPWARDATLTVDFLGFPPRSRLEDWQVVAAPVPMWEQIPEAFLPRWPLHAKGRARVPLDPSVAWRIRVLGPGLASHWVDVPPGGRVATARVSAAVDKILTIFRSSGERVTTGALTVLSQEDARTHQRVLTHFLVDEDGEIRMPGMSGGREFGFTLANRNDSPMAFSADPRRLPSEVHLAEGVRAQGTLRDQDREPIQGARVRVEAWMSSTHSALFSRAVTSGEDGRWSIGGIPRRPLAFVLAGDGFSTVVHEVADPEAVVDLGTTFLSAGLKLALLVEDESGGAVPGAEVHFGNGQPVWTDPQGGAELSGVAPQSNLGLRITAEGYLCDERVLSAPFPERLKVSLTRGFSVQGALVDEEGLAIPEAEVEVALGADFQTQQLASDGSFSIPLPPEKEAILTFSSPTTLPRSVPLTTGRAGEALDLGTLVASTGLRVLGRLVRETDGAPVQGARVWTPQPSDRGQLVSWMLRQLKEAGSDADGVFTVAGLPRAPAVLRVDAPGLGRHYLEVAPSPEQPQVDVGTVYLSAGREVRVQVPEAAALGQRVAKLDLRQQWLDFDMLTASVLDGEAVFESVPHGDATLIVQEGRRRLCEVKVRVTQSPEPLLVDCATQALEVSGAVQIGDGAAGAGLLVWSAPGPEVPGAIFNARSPAGLVRQKGFGGSRALVEVAVEEDGSFVTQELTPGSWRVRWFSEAGAGLPPVEIDLPDSDRYSAVLSFPGTRISGIVLDASGEVVAGAQVEELISGAAVVSQQDGTFHFLGLDQKEVRLRGRVGPQFTSVADRTLNPEASPDPVELVLQEESGGQVTLRLVREDASPIENGFLFLEDSRGSRKLLTTNGMGEVRSRFAPPYPDRLRSAAYVDGRWTLGSWVDWREATESGLFLTFEESSASLAVHSEKSAGTPELVGPQGWNLTLLLRQLGLPLHLSPRTPLRLQGLPEATYTVRLGESLVIVSVQAGDETEVRLN